jgi:hypothetical protein
MFAALIVIVTIVGYVLPSFGDLAATIVNVLLLLGGVIAGAMLGSRALSRDSAN